MKRQLLFIFSLLSLPFVVNAATTWSEPSCDPSVDPTVCNISAPINVSATTQTKAGGLAITGALSTGSSLTVAGATTLNTTLGVAGAVTIAAAGSLNVNGPSTLGNTVTVNGTGMTVNAPLVINNSINISALAKFTYTGTRANFSLPNTAGNEVIVDNEVSDTLTSSIYKGTGSTTNAIDLATAEVSGILPAASVTDIWVNTSGGDTIAPTTAVTALSITPFNTNTGINISGGTGSPLINLVQTGSTGTGIDITLGDGTTKNAENITMNGTATGHALAIISNSASSAAYPLEVDSKTTVTRSIYSTNVAATGYGVYSTASGGGSVGVLGASTGPGGTGVSGIATGGAGNNVGVSGDGTTIGVQGNTNTAGAKGVYGTALDGYAGYFTAKGGGDTALYANLSSGATTVGSVAIQGVGKNGYGGYFTTDGVGSTALYANNSSASATGQVAKFESTGNATGGIVVSTKGIGLAITTNTTTANAPGITISASGGQKGITISASSTGVDVDTTADTGIEANDTNIQTTGAFFGGQFYAGGTPSGLRYSNVQPYLVDTISPTSSGVGNRARGLYFDGSDVWMPTGDSASVLGDAAVQRINAYNDNPTVAYYPNLVWAGVWMPGAMVMARDTMYVFNTGAVSREFMKIHQNSDTTTGYGTLSAAASFRSAVYDGTYIWLGTTNSIGKLNLTTDTRTSVQTGLGEIYDMLYVDGYIWALDYDNGRVYKIDSSGTTVGTITVGTHPIDMEYDGAFIWVANYSDHTLTRINVKTSGTSTVNLTATTGVGPLAFDGYRLWFIDGTQLYSYSIRDGSIGTPITLSTNQYTDLIYDGSYLWAGNGSSVDKISIGGGRGYAMPAYPGGIILYGDDAKYHCIYFNSVGTIQNSTTLTECR